MQGDASSQGQPLIIGCVLIACKWGLVGTEMGSMWGVHTVFVNRTQYLCVCGGLYVNVCS